MNGKRCRAAPMAGADREGFLMNRESFFMKEFASPAGFASACSILLYSSSSAAQQPPAGYFDIPPGFDFPADKQTLEHDRAAADVHAQRLHAWNVFAGMTQPTPDG